MTRTAFSTFFALLATVIGFLPAGAAPRVAIVQAEDPFTRALGLSEFLAAEKIAFKDLSDDFQSGRTPSLSEVDLLIVGSFVTALPEMRNNYRSVGAVLNRFVENGGVVAVLTQADQHEPNETWIPAPRRLTRADPDAGTVFATQPNHPLLKQIVAADLAGWRVPVNWTSPNTAWEAFSQWTEASVILGTSDTSSPATAALIEMGWGKGRALFYAMAPDKAFVAGNDVSQGGAVKLLRNLLAYAELVCNAKAPPVQITQPPGYKHQILGTIYLDTNGNGQRDEGEPGGGGVAVSDGLDVVLTDETGAYRLPNEGKNAVFVFVHQPSDVKQSGQHFFHRLPNDGGPSNRFDFGLQPAPVAQHADGSAIRFVQLTDSHVRNVSDRDYMQQATSEIYAMKPPPDFVVATGDLVDWGVDEQFQNYVAGMRQPPVPYFNVFGNHEIVYGPIERYHQYIGPDYFSFERGGILFLALNCVTPAPRQDAWLARTLKTLGRGRPVVAFQHFPPSLSDLERFAGMGVKSVFSGHWHSEKEMEHGSVQSINSPTFIMGGIDASPAGFKIVRLAADGSAETEWRYGFQNKRLTIVSPQKGSPVRGSYFPVIINAYDTAREVLGVKWRLGDEEQPTASGELRRESALAWSGTHKTELPRGSYPFRVEARDEQGGTWSANHQVDVLPGKPTAPRPGGDWPMFMGDPAHSGFTPQKLATPLRLAWSADTGGDPDFASPIIADGRLYLALKKRTRNRTNGVAAFDPVTGRRLWLFETPMAINHTPAFSKGILCVAEMGGRVYGLESATGRKLWHHDLIDSRARYSYCAPAAHEGSFYAGVMRRLARLRVTDGAVEWEQRMGGGDNDWISSYGSPAVAGGYVAMSGQFSSGGAVTLAAAADGTKAWDHPADGGMLGSATIAGDRVLFCSQKSVLHCRRLSDGGELWQQALGEKGSAANWSATTPAVKMSSGAGIVVAGSGDGRMSAVDLASGKILWTHTSDPTVFKVSPYRRDDRPLLSSPTIAGDTVFFGSADGHVYGVELATGQVKWSFVIGASVMSTPLVTGNALYVAAYDGRLYAFTAGTETNP